MPQSRILSRQDVDFLLHDWLDVKSLTSRPRYAEHDVHTFRAVLDLSESIAEAHFAPHQRKSDLAEPRVNSEGNVDLIPEIGAALAVYTDSGLGRSTFDGHLGGMQLPFVVHQAASLFFQAANAPTFAYAFLAAANANLICAYGTSEQVERYAQPVIDGRWFGTMCLSEPQAGSSLADITTRALPQGDGSYRLHGTKMWISGGDHELGENIVHLVLAKIPGGGPGVKGISLFIVPKYLPWDDGTLGDRNDVSLVGLNHKMGWRGTVNALLNFGDGSHPVRGAPGAVGFLVGEPHRGLDGMFHMMNEARISVGAGAVGLGYSGYLISLDYARNRTQGRLVDDKDPGIPQVTLTEHPDVRRMLLAQKSFVEGGLALVLYCARLVDEAATATDASTRDKAARLLEVLTPVAKSWPSQWCLEANDLAIQVLGGSGYTRDHPVEQLYRDNRLNPIHEGTHGIQAIDLLGRKARARGGADFALLADLALATARRAEETGGSIAQLGSSLRHHVDRLVSATEAVWAPGDPRLALANATLHLEATGHIVVAWLWLEQLLAVGNRQGPFFDGKRAAARYFYAFELPTVTPKLDLLTSLDRTTLDLDPAVL